MLFASALLCGAHMGHKITRTAEEVPSLTSDPTPRSAPASVAADAAQPSNTLLHPSITFPVRRVDTVLAFGTKQEHSCCPIVLLEASSRCLLRPLSLPICGRRSPGSRAKAGGQRVFSPSAFPTSTDACRVAAETAAHNSARLRTCELIDGDVTVNVSVSMATATARAGPL